MIIAFGVIAGGPVLGYLTDKTFEGQKRPFLTACIAIQVLNWALIAFVSPRLGSWALGCIFFIMGMMLAGTLAVVWAIVREESPPERMGTAMGMLNPPLLSWGSLSSSRSPGTSWIGWEKSAAAFPWRPTRRSHPVSAFSFRSPGDIRFSDQNEAAE